MIKILYVYLPLKLHPFLTAVQDGMSDQLHTWSKLLQVAGNEPATKHISAMHFTDWAVMAVFLQQILPDSV
jgi:hypothetical protein